MRNLVLLFLCLFFTLTTRAQNPVLSFVIDSQTVSEASVSYQIAVSISSPNANPTSVGIYVAGGNAVAGTNYTYSPSTITFPASSSSVQYVTVQVIDDSIPDGSQWVTFGFDTVSATNNATIGSPGTFTLVMTDADTPKISFRSTRYTTPEDTTPINIGVSLNRGVRDTTKVYVLLLPTGTTAVDSVDFTFNDTMLVWPPDSAGTINVSIPLINNPFYERDRTVQLGAYFPTNNAVVVTDSSTFTLDIKANSDYTLPNCSDLFFGQYVEGYNLDRAVQIYNPTDVTIDLSVYSILISYSGGSYMTQYNLSGTIEPKGVYVVSNDNARAGILAYANATSGLIDFDGTDAVALLHNTDTIDIIGQLYVIPPSPGFIVGNACGMGNTHQHTLIRNYFDYAGDTSWARAALTWDVYRAELIDSLGFHHTDTCGGIRPIATIRFLTAYDTVSPAPQPPWDILMVIAEVNNPTGDTVDFAMAYNDSLSTAKRGLAYDYQFINDLISSPPGISYDTGYVYILPSDLVSPVKTVYLEFTDLPCNAKAIADSVHIIYIVNSNIYNVSFLGAAYSYPKNAGLVEIPITIDEYASEPTTVDVTLSTGSAVLGQDFLFNDTTVTFPAYSVDTQGVWVTIINNSLFEVNRQANFNLSNPSNGAVLGISGFTLTIINDDSLSGITPIDDGGISIFPNPVNNVISVKTDDELDNVIISDLLGNLVMKIDKLSQGNSNLDVSRLSSGMYFINLQRNGQLLTIRFAKTN